MRMRLKGGESLHSPERRLVVSRPAADFYDDFVVFIDGLWRAEGMDRLAATANAGRSFASAAVELRRGTHGSAPGIHVKWRSQRSARLLRRAPIARGRAVALPETTALPPPLSGTASRPRP